MTLGDYDPAARQGPAYWIRCVVAGTVDAGLAGRARRSCTCRASLASAAAGRRRVPAGARADRRAAVPQPVVLASERPGLDGSVAAVARRARASACTSPTTPRPAPRCCSRSTGSSTSRIDRLATQLLDADFFRDLINPDPVRSLLGWLDDPAGLPHAARRRAVDGVRAAVQGRLRLRPDDRRRDHRRPEARRRARARGRRSGSASPRRPSAIPGIPDQLRKARPRSSSSSRRDAWPQDNETAEDQLAQQPARLRRRSPPRARGRRSLALDAEHAWRRGTVWADLDLAPLAFAARAARAARRADRAAARRRTISTSLTADYADRGWRADDAVLRALAAARDAADREAVVGARSRRCTGRGSTRVPRRSRRRSARWPTPTPTQPGPPASTATGSVTVFVDGLRLDVAHRVHDAPGRRRPRRRRSTTSLAALPTVTQTAKPALVPVADGSARRRAGSASSERGDGHQGVDPGAALADGRQRRAGPGPDRDRRPVGHGVGRGRRGRPPRPRRRHPARRLPRRGGRADRRAASASCSTPAGSGSTS